MTTTLAAIMARAVTVIEALTPVTVPLNDEDFNENKAPHPRLARWTLAGPEAHVFRLFEVAPAQGAERVDFPHQDPEETMCIETFVVTIAYPNRASLLGLEELREVWAVMAADALQIRNALATGAGLESDSHIANFVKPKNPDLTRDHILFQEITVRAQFYAAQ